MTIDFTCPHCGLEMHAPEATAGKRGKCKSCNGSVTVPPPPPPLGALIFDNEPEIVQARPRPRSAANSPQSSPVQVHVTQTQVYHQQPSNALGIISIILGAMALCVTWVPLLGVFGIPTAMLGGLLGGIAILISLSRGGSGILYGIIGVGLSVFAVIIFLAMTAAIVSGVSHAADEEIKRAAAREAARQQVTPVEQKKVIPTPPKPPATPKVEPETKPEQPVVKEPEPTAEPLPEVVFAKKQFPGDPFYGRSVILPRRYSRVEVIAFAQKMLATQERTTGVIDFFDSPGPLTWSGLMAINSDSTKAKWLCRVYISDDKASYELGKDKNGKERSDAFAPD